MGLVPTRIGLEAGPLSQWLYARMRDAGLLSSFWRRRTFARFQDHAGKDGPEGSMEAQETRPMLTARKLVQRRFMSLLGVLRGFGLKIGKAKATINRFVAQTNHDPKPFTWTVDPDKIIAAVRRGHQVLDSIHWIGRPILCKPHHVSAHRADPGQKQDPGEKM
jgi:hypothetical protein